MGENINKSDSLFYRLSSKFPSIKNLSPEERDNILTFISSYLADTEYQLVWPGKASIQKTIAEVPITRLIPDPGSSYNWEFSEHLFIEGENLEVLKLLQKEFEETVQTIYIDPPYNTGKKNFVFQDHFSAEASESFIARHKKSNNETQQSLQHAQWLSMMYPRLFLGRQLLKDDGVIFVSIDENELANLKLVLDEIFGQENFVEIFSWAKSETPANLSRKSKKVVEYVLCYQKKRNPAKFQGIRKKVISSNGLLNQSNKVNTLEFPPGIVKTSLPDQVLLKGTYGTDKYHIELLGDTEVKDGLFIKPVRLKAKFKWTQPKLDNEIKSGTLIRIPTLKLSPSYERNEYSAEVPPNLINAKVGVSTNEVAGEELAQLLGAKVFDFPKPTSLIKYLLGFNDDPNGIVLDFFAGSGATAQAVLEMNEKDGGYRKFVCIQIDELTPEHSLARKKGYLKISQITKARIEAVLKKLRSRGNQAGCRFYTTELI